MAVWVDDMRRPATLGPVTSEWSHLMADSTDELVAFAGTLGLEARWVQYPGTWKEHFDVSEETRLRAVASGAEEVTLRELTMRARARRRSAQPSPLGGDGPAD
jgi:Protein of unknown function (DUF4031)